MVVKMKMVISTSLEEENHWTSNFNSQGAKKSLFNICGFRG